MEITASVEYRAYRNRKRPTINIAGLGDMPIVMAVYATASGDCYRMDNLERFVPTDEWELIETQIPAGAGIIVTLPGLGRNLGGSD